MGKRGTLTIKFDMETGSNRYQYSKMTMEDLSQHLRTCLGAGDHKIADETGIQGTYQVVYDCPLTGLRPRPSGADGGGMLPSDPEGGSTLNRSLDAMGLKLEKRKVMQDVYVIDRIDRPSEN